MDKSRILNRINKYKYVSFDIFDTLLKRDVLVPKDVFDIVEKRYLHETGTKTGFKEARIAAEKKARETSRYPDVTIDEIYNEMDFADQLKLELKAMELETEAAVLHANYDLKPVFDYCVRSGIQIFITSDMYLPSEFLETVLNREGYNDYKNIYVSCEHRAKKRSGDLFRVLCSKEGIRPNELIHIGDSRYADYIGPMRTGIRAIHINRLINKTLYYLPAPGKDSLEKGALFSFINNRIRDQEDRGHKLGYETLGPIIYAYCNWIHSEYEKYKRVHPDSKLWLIARDMFLFKEAYQMLFNGSDEEDYIYLSRKSLRPTLVYSTDDITESGNVFARGEYTLQDIIKYMGYLPEDVENVEQYDLKKKYNIRKLALYPEVVNALSSPRIEKAEKEQGEIGFRYLQEHGLTNKDIVLADVGWHGTTQYILEKIQEKAAEDQRIKGLYLGCLDGTNEKIGKDNYYAFLFDEDSESLLKKGIILFESLILAPHGSTIGYKEATDTVIPVLGEPDNVTHYIESVQRGALEFVRDFKNSILSQVVFMDGKCVSEAFGRLTTEPKKEELCDIGQLEYDNFYKYRVADPQSIVYYICHPKQLYKDLKFAPWRIGFMYRLFKVRLPYAKMYSFMRRKMGKQT